jgi:hypothetical protein
VFREIPADLQASTIFAVLAIDERNGSRHGNALCTEFDECFDIIPRTVQMNVTTGILDASCVSGGPRKELRLADFGKKSSLPCSAPDEACATSSDGKRGFRVVS